VAAGVPEDEVGDEDGARDEEDEDAELPVFVLVAGLPFVVVLLWCAEVPAWAEAGKTAAIPATPSALATPAAAVTTAILIRPRRRAAWARVVGSFMFPSVPGVNGSPMPAVSANLLSGPAQCRSRRFPEEL
jgi:hypothetical protein